MKLVTVSATRTSVLMTLKLTKNIYLWTFMATMKVVEFVKIVNTTLKVSIVIVVRQSFTDQQTNPGTTPTYVNVSIQTLFIKKKSDIENFIYCDLNNFPQLVTAITSTQPETVLNPLGNVNADLNINLQIVMLVVMDISVIQIADLVNVI